VQGTGLLFISGLKLFINLKNRAIIFTKHAARLEQGVVIMEELRIFVLHVVLVADQVI
jgi:hypothetical protein